MLLISSQQWDELSMSTAVSHSLFPFRPRGIYNSRRAGIPNTCSSQGLVKPTQSADYPLTALRTKPETDLELSLLYFGCRL